MAFQDQSSSWLFKGNSPNTWFYEDESLRVRCLICYGKNGSNHVTENCPEERIQQLLSQRKNSWRNQDDSTQIWGSNNWNSPGSNQWENRDVSFQGLQQEISPNRENLQWNGQSNSDLQLSENNLPVKLCYWCRATDHDFLHCPTLGIKQGSPSDAKFEDNQTGQKEKTNRDQMEQRITNLELAKSSSDEIIEAQAKKIESLEEAVKKLESRLKQQQQEQIKQHEANLRRIKQINIEIPNLRERLVRIDSMLRQIQQEEVNHIHSNYIDDSSDEEEDDVIRLQDTPGSRDKKMPSLSPNREMTLEIKEQFKIRDEHSQFPNPNNESSQAVLSTDKDSQVDSHNKEVKEFFAQFWEDIQSQVDDDQSSEQNRNAPQRKDNLQSTVPYVLKPKTESCSGCGLNCAHQLRACVNMIQVKPSMKKVKENEIKSMKSKQKRKLQRQWIPRGIFDIKEIFNVDTLLSEIQCAKQYMPRWKKKRQSAPTISDSHD